MILVDTSVWIDYFAGRDKRHVEALEQHLLAEDNLAICGIVLTEILQGIVEDSQVAKVRGYLSPVIMLPMGESVFVGAAQIYRALRKKGITIRKTNDCIIAATARYHRCELLHADKDFDLIEQYYH